VVVVVSFEGKGKRYGVEVARKVEARWGPLGRTVSRLELGLDDDVLLSRILCDRLAKEGERDASVYHALSTGGNFGLFGVRGGVSCGIMMSEKPGETGEIGNSSSFSGLGVEGLSRRTLMGLQLIGGGEREVNASLIFRQKVLRTRDPRLLE
jgi:hypothetical protein